MGTTAHQHTPSETLKPERVLRVDQLSIRAGVRAVVVSDPVTLRWLGVSRPDGLLGLISAGDGLLLGSDSGDLAVALELCGVGDGDRVGGDRRLADVWHTVDLSAEIAAARAVKDAEEIARISSAAELVNVGHRSLRDALAVGASELELWTAARAAIERELGGPARANVDLMTGERTALIGEPPTHSRVRAGDPVLLDLAPERQCYWADSCVTVACGEPSRALVRRHSAVRAALETGLSAVRPGVLAGAVDQIVRSALDDAGLTCPHHIGHGVGTAPQEPPWLVPGAGTVLEEGMVIALEPGAYADGFGVRLEHLAVVEAEGARLLTDHDLSLVA